ncbi:MAG: S8 family serine peptidase [Desulfobulbaceae bacterium]|nr:S8 family serine peptidase [Desulfobulbaceae bacterium]
MLKQVKIFIICLFLALFAGQAALSAQIRPELQSRLDVMSQSDEIPVIVTLRDQVNPQAYRKLSKRLRQKKLITDLREKANRSQKPLKNLISLFQGRKFRSLWLVNSIAFTAKPRLIKRLANHPAVASVKLDAVVTLSPQTMNSSSLPEWNIDAIGVPDLWNLGYTGQGVVVANMDTGVDFDHPDLMNSWRGGSNSWYDPNNEYALPHDSDGHGTQVMGLMVGGDAGGSAIGVAPGAQWIGVKIFNDQGEASLSAIHLGYQWLLDPDGDPLTDDSPDIVNNSWGFPEQLNQCYQEFLTDIQMLKAAEIAVVFSAGNKGPLPYTSVSPANYSESFAVGATDFTDTLSDFSSRGPSPCDPDGVFPDVVAPGVSIKTADLTTIYGIPNVNPYTSVTGTSFAAPQVAGAMALLLSAAPTLTVTDLENIVRQSAWDQGLTGPDNDYGSGFVSLPGALALIPGINLCISDLDVDGDVDGSDVFVFAAETGRFDCSETTPCLADLTNDGAVDSSDLSLLLDDMGRSDCFTSPVP